MTRREAVRVLLFERASLVGFDGGVRCAVVELSAVGALLTITAPLPRPPLRLEFALDEEAVTLAVEVRRASSDGRVVVTFVDPPVDRLHHLIAVEQRLAIAAGRVNVRERRSRRRQSPGRGPTRPPAFRVARLFQSPAMAVRPRRRSRSLPGVLPVAAPGEVLVWTDGACRRNPGPGGWAALVCWEDGVVEEHSGGSPGTTNNVMEMTAALEGLRALPPGSRACVVTDSRYLHDGMTSWLAGWKRRGWTTASGDPVKNKSIWVGLDAAASDHERVRWHWVKGHIGHELNERADLLATAAASTASGRT